MDLLFGIVRWVSDHDFKSKLLPMEFSPQAGRYLKAWVSGRCGVRSLAVLFLFIPCQVVATTRRVTHFLPHADQFSVAFAVSLQGTQPLEVC